MVEFVSGGVLDGVVVDDCVSGEKGEGGVGVVGDGLVVVGEVSDGVEGKDGGGGVVVSEELLRVEVDKLSGLDGGVGVQRELVARVGLLVNRGLSVELSGLNYGGGGLSRSLLGWVRLYGDLLAGLHKCVVGDKSSVVVRGVSHCDVACRIREFSGGVVEGVLVGKKEKESENENK